jgi:hypothetical protein
LMVLVIMVLLWGDHEMMTLLIDNSSSLTTYFLARYL